MQPRYARWQDGKIIPPWHAELPVADHCNLACRDCNHASPVMPRWFADPAQVHRDCAVLAPLYRPRRIKVLGGEPLLHPALAEVVEAARKTGICDTFKLVTNGTLLDRLDARTWRAFDIVEVSLFPGVDRALEQIEEARRQAQSHGVKLEVNTYEQFRATFTLRGTDDPALTRKIFHACKIAWVWGCHTIRAGRLYRCPQSAYIQHLTKLPEEEGIPIRAAPDFGARLFAFLNDREPLQSCTHCCGTVGTLREQVQVKRKEWWEGTGDVPTEQLVDRDWLERTPEQPDFDDDCKHPAGSSPLALIRRVLGLGKRRSGPSFAEARRGHAEGRGS